LGIGLLVTLNVETDNKKWTLSSEKKTSRRFNDERHEGYGREREHSYN